MTRPATELYEAARRLRLGHPALLNHEQYEVASRCLGCIVRVERGVRRTSVVPGCPVHSKAA